MFMYLNLKSLIDNEKEKIQLFLVCKKNTEILYESKDIFLCLYWLSLSATNSKHHRLHHKTNNSKKQFFITKRTITNKFL